MERHVIHGLLLQLIVISSLTCAYCTTPHFALCLTSHGVTNFTTRHSPQFNHLFYSKIRNLNFAVPNIHKPIAIILPESETQLKTAIQCSIKGSLTIRLRSGGHSYEGMSYRAQTPFVIIDLTNLNRITIDLDSETAWVETGATIGQIYHTIANSSARHGFSAGYSSSIGSGGHISGGGWGMLTRKYGLAADNVIDAVLIDANGRSLDRDAMGEDVFWAIRGGGGGNWGAVYSWKIRLLPVPKTVTTFVVKRIGTQTQTAELLHKWQFVAPELDDEFYVMLIAEAVSENELSVTFYGSCAVPKAWTHATMTQAFPELGLEEDDCNEMSWIDATDFFSERFKHADESFFHTKGDVARREGKSFLHMKADIARETIPLEGLKGAMEWLAKEPKGFLGFMPNGGIMRRIRSDSIPFPHRASSLFNILYAASWNKEDNQWKNRYNNWVRGLNDYLTPFVSKDPRATEVNALDLDFGVMDWENVSSCDAWRVAKAWGERYFMGNYNRLVRVKTLIDPNNVFRNPQSIPPLPDYCSWRVT